MMDFAERGAVEKTLDDILDSESPGFREAGGADLIESSGELTPAGRLYTAGILTGILATIRTFADETSELTSDEIDEIDQIVSRREREMAARLTEPSHEPAAGDS